MWNSPASAICSKSGLGQLARLLDLWGGMANRGGELAGGLERRARAAVGCTHGVDRIRMGALAHPRRGRRGGSVRARETACGRHGQDRGMAAGALGTLQIRADSTFSLRCDPTSRRRRPATAQNTGGHGRRTDPQERNAPMKRFRSAALIVAALTTLATACAPFPATASVSTTAAPAPITAQAHDHDHESRCRRQVLRLGRHLAGRRGQHHVGRPDHGRRGRRHRERQHRHHHGRRHLSPQRHRRRRPGRRRGEEHGDGAAHPRRGGHHLVHERPAVRQEREVGGDRPGGRQPELSRGWRLPARSARRARTSRTRPSSATSTSRSAATARSPSTGATTTASPARTT